MEDRLLILCVDDDPDIREATVRVALQSGHDVRQASTGQEGLSLAAEVRPDILLLDNVLPDIGGLEIAHRLKSDDKTAGIYIAILSGTKTESGDKVEGFEAGADEYIARPIPNRELRARLQAMIRLVQTEKRLRRSLRERDFFLRELNHRTRNNFALAASLLNLEAENISDDRGKAALRNSRDRLRALALVHDQLFQGISRPSVSARKYLGDLALSLHKALAPAGVSLETDIEDIDLNLRQAIPCGLIVNELITNTFKYAFPPSRQEGGRVRLSLRASGGRAALSVEDNGAGRGAPEAGSGGSSFGLSMIEILVRDQLEGEIRVSVSGGYRTEIAFSLLSAGSEA